MQGQVYAIAGPTATGKTEVAISLAKRIDGEILCADSMQIYKGLDIGTAKPTTWQMAEVPHHLYGFVDPAERYSVARYVEDATRVAEEILSRGRTPILCGGTGQYISAFADGITFTPAETDPALRADIYAELEEKGAQALIDEIAQADAQHAAALHPNNRKRIVRAVELLRTAGLSIPQQNAASRPKHPPFAVSVAVLHSPDRQQLYSRIEHRVDEMMAQGLLDEARRVFDDRARYGTAAQAIGYKEFFPYVEGQAALADCVDKLKQATRNYAKRQLTWFRRIDGAVWYDISNRTAGDLAREIINQKDMEGFS